MRPRSTDRGKSVFTSLLSLAIHLASMRPRSTDRGKLFPPLQRGIQWSTCFNEAAINRSRKDGTTRNGREVLHLLQ